MIQRLKVQDLGFQCASIITTGKMPVRGAGGANDNVDGGNPKQPPGMYKTL